MSWLLRSLGGAKEAPKAAVPSSTYSANPQNQLQGPTGWPYGLDNFFAYKLKWASLTVPKSTIGWGHIPKEIVHLPEPYTKMQGVLLTALWHVRDEGALASLCPVLTLEDQRLDFSGWPFAPFSWSMLFIDAQFIDAASGLSKGGSWHWGQWDAALGYYTLWFTGQLPYSSNFEIGFENTSQASSFTGYVSAWLLLERRRTTK